MSFLSEHIKSIIKENDSFSLKKGIENLEKEIKRKIKKLIDSNDLRIYDKKEGGALRGPINSRKKYEEGSSLLCDPQYMTHSKIKTLEGKTLEVPSEVPYMRALFNNKELPPYELIAYEMPLMRKKRQKTNPEISGRELSCDLLGYQNKELCCIEIKTNPNTPSTYPVYALLEGFAYATCLKYLKEINEDEFHEELNLCYNQFGSKQLNLPIEDITFAVAAPEKDYFSPFVEENLNNHTRQWFINRKNEVRKVEEIISDKYSGWFKGYFSLPIPINKIEPSSPSTSLPVRPTIPKELSFIIRDCFGSFPIKD